jgi:hypothetical protein
MFDFALSLRQSAGEFGDSEKRVLSPLVVKQGG